VRQRALTLVTRYTRLLGTWVWYWLFWWHDSTFRTTL